MKKSILFVSLVLFASVFNVASAALKIVTTTQDLAAIAESIGGQHVEVFSLTPGTRDPHFAEAKPSMIRKVYSADLLLEVGAELGETITGLPGVSQGRGKTDCT